MRRYEPEMRQALAVAREAGLHGDVPMGAVVLEPDGLPVEVGGSECKLTGDPTAHTEVAAIRHAAEVLGRWRLTGCTLMAVLEPCTMCVGTIVAARIDHLVFGALDDKTGAVTSLLGALRDPCLDHRPKMTSGVPGTDCAAPLEEFFEERR